ncbi:MAG: hypothetical protein U0230_06240 [Polyangiales bacterium]
MVAAIAWLGVQAGRHVDFTVDDAGVSFAYARTLAESGELDLYPGAERVEAATNLLWCLLLAPFAWLHLDVELASKVLGIAFASLAAIGIGFLPSRLERRAPRLVDAFAPALLASLPSYALWSVAGLENGLVAMLLVAAVLALDHEEGDASRRPWSGLLLALGFMARPDVGLYAAAFGIPKLLRTVSERRLRRQDLLWLAFAAAPMVGLTVFRMLYYAWPVPNSFYAKQGGLSVGSHLFDPAKNPGFAYVGEFVKAGRLVPVAACVPLVLGARRGGVVRGALFLSSVVFFALPIYSHGDWMEQHRFLTFGAPLFLVAATIGLSRLPEALLSCIGPRSERVGAVVGALAVLGLVAYSLEGFTVRSRIATVHSTLSFHDVTLRSQYFEQFAASLGVDERPLLLDADIGGTSYRRRIDILDHFGLADVPVARAYPNRQGHVRESIFGERAPTFVHLHGAWTTHTRLLEAPFFAAAYTRLPSSSPGGLVDAAFNYVRRDLVASPAPELAHVVPGRGPRAPGSLVGATLSGDAFEPGDPLVVELGIAGPARTTARGRLEIVTEGDRVVASRAVIPLASRIGATDFGPSEVLRARVWVRPPRGRFRVRYVDTGGHVTQLGSLRVHDEARDETASRSARDFAPLSLGSATPRTTALAVAAALRAATTHDAVARARVDDYVRFLVRHALALEANGATELAAATSERARRFAEHGGSVSRLSLRFLADRFSRAARARLRTGATESAFELSIVSVRLDPRRAWDRRHAESLRGRRTTPYDGERDAAATRMARAARRDAALLEDAVLFLAENRRWAEAVDLVAIVGRQPLRDLARLAVARGHLVRGEVEAASVHLLGLRCVEGSDPELIAVLERLQGPLPGVPAACRAPGRRPPPPFDDAVGSFESGSYRGWQVGGAAFGPGPADRTREGQHLVTGYRGLRFASSFARGDDARGTLRSPPFRVEAPALSFVVAGGADCETVGVRLLIDGREVTHSCGVGTSTFRRVFVDLRPYRGRHAVIEAYDRAGGAWGHVLFDDLRLEPAFPVD